MPLLNLALVGLLIVVAGLVGVIWAFQNYGIYDFRRGDSSQSPTLPEGVRSVKFQSSDGEMIGARLAPPVPGRPVFVSFYGNGADIDTSFQRLQQLRDLGYGIAVMEYRGSGATGGKPSEMNFARDALAFYDQLDELMGQPVPPSSRVLHGFSLGAGVGSRLAAQRPFAAVVLEAAPYRTCLYYQDRYRGFPFCWLMWAERYDIIDHVRGIDAPKLFVHGELDEALPVARARRLYEEAPEPKQYLEIPDGHHADLDRLGLLPAMASFASENASP